MEPSDDLNYTPGWKLCVRLGPLENRITVVGEKSYLKRSSLSSNNFPCISMDMLQIGALVEAPLAYLSCNYLATMYMQCAILYSMACRFPNNMYMYAIQETKVLFALPDQLCRSTIVLILLRMSVKVRQSVMCNIFCHYLLVFHVHFSVSTRIFTQWGEMLSQR